MPKILVAIEYDSPTDPYWLNPGNVALALNQYCSNTNFKASWAENGDPWSSQKKEKSKTKVSNTKRDEISQALACGYGSPKNAHKALDIDLIEGMADELVKLLKNSTLPSNNIEEDVILAAGYKWANGNPNAFGVNGFQAGVEWALKY